MAAHLLSSSRPVAAAPRARREVTVARSEWLPRGARAGGGRGGAAPLLLLDGDRGTSRTAGGDGGAAPRRIGVASLSRGELEPKADAARPFLPATSGRDGSRRCARPEEMMAQLQQRSSRSMVAACQ